MPRLRFNPYSTPNPMSVLATGLSGIGESVAASARERALRAEEEARYQQQREDMLAHRDQLQRNWQADYDYDVARDRTADQRAGAAHELGMIERGYRGIPIPDRTETGVATIGGDGYTGQTFTEQRGGIGSRSRAFDIEEPQADVYARSREGVVSAQERQQELQDAEEARKARLADERTLIGERAEAQKGILSHGASLKGGDADMDLTEGQRKDASYINRLNQSVPVVQAYLKKHGGQADYRSGLGRFPIIGRAIGPTLSGSGAKEFNAAVSDMVGALLRKETGAAISKEEWDYANRVWVPTFWDTPASTAQKMRNVQAAYEAMKVDMPPAAYAPSSPSWSIEPDTDGDGGDIPEGWTDDDEAGYLEYLRQIGTGR